MATDKCICIVDDNEPVRKSIVALFRAYGYSVSSYASAEELLNAREWDRLGCLVVDFNMPGLNGLQLLHTLQKWGVNIPVLVLSGRVTAEEVTQLELAGAAEIVHKPVNGAELMQTIGDLMSDAIAYG